MWLTEWKEGSQQLARFRAEGMLQPIKQVTRRERAERQPG